MSIIEIAKDLRKETRKLEEEGRERRENAELVTSVVVHREETRESAPCQIPLAGGCSGKCAHWLDPDMCARRLERRFLLERIKRA